MRLTLAALVTLGALACGSPAAEQERKPVVAKDPAKPAASLPDGWKGRFDDATATPTGSVTVEKDAIVFTGVPAGVYYKSAMKAERDYTATAAFTQQQSVTVPQPYGLFVSGADLDKDTRRYTAFMVRQDGKYQIVTMHAGKETVHVNWRTASPMIELKGVKPTNTLEVRALQNGVHFLIGDKEVHQMPREKVGADGIAGVRIGSGLNVQVTKLEVKKFP